MAILTPLPPTLGPAAASSPFTPDTPPHLAKSSNSTPSKVVDSANDCADLLDLTFVDDDAPAKLPSPISTSTAVAKYNAWAPLIPDGPKGTLLPEEGDKKDQTPAGGDPADGPTGPATPGQRVVVVAPSNPPEAPAVDDGDLASHGGLAEGSGEHTTRNSSFEIQPSSPSASKTPQRRSSSLNGAAPAFDASAIRSPSTFDTSESDANESLTSPRQSDYSALDTENTAEWAMQQGFGGFGHIPIPDQSTPAPLPSVRRMSYHTMPTSTPIRITSPVAKTAKTVPDSHAKPSDLQRNDEHPDPVECAGTQDDISVVVTANSTERPETPASGLTEPLPDLSPSTTEPPHGKSARERLTDDAQFTNDHPEAADTRHLVLDPWAQGLSEVGSLEACWVELREAFGRFGGGMEEVSERLQHVMSSHFCRPEDASNTDALSGARVTLVRLQDQLATAQEALSAASARRDELEQTKALVDAKLEQADAEAIQAKRSAKEARGREDIWRSTVDRVRANNDSLLADQQYWHKRERELAKGFIALENDYVALVDKYKALKTGGNSPKRETFAVALLDVSPNLFDPELLQRGEEGGKTLAIDIAEAVRASTASKVDTILIQLFLDFPKLSKTLKEDRIIRKESQLHDFLDGFRTVSTLNTVNDCAVPSSVLRDHAKLYVRLGAATIIIGTRQNDEMVEMVRQADKHSSHVLRFIRTRRSAEEDQWADIASDRMIHMPNITPGHGTVHTRQSSVFNGSDGYTEIVTPAPPKRSLRERIADALVTPSDSISSVGQTDDQTPYLAASEQRPAPWMQRTDKRPTWRVNLPSPPPRDKTPVPYWEQGTTLLDAHLAEEAMKQSQYGEQVTPRSTGLHSDISSPTPRKSFGLSIPIDGDEGSLAGSPPDSDEDTPSVPLPHSAVKHVQRPTPVQLRSASPSESSGVSSKTKYPYSTQPSHRDETSRAYDHKRASRLSSGAGARASTTGSNTTPLGSMRIKGASENKIHGFKVHERKPWLERREQ